MIQGIEMEENSYCCYILDNLVEIYNEFERLLYTYNFMGDHLLHIYFPDEFPEEFYSCVKEYIDLLKQQSLKVLHHLPGVCETCSEDVRMLISNYEAINYC